MATNLFTRQAAAYKNDLNRSLGALLGIAQGMLCDGHLSDQEIQFLESWLQQNDSVATAWPGDVVYARIRDALSDGIITHEEREYLTQTLQLLVGGTLEEMSESTHVTELALDRNALVMIPNATFCMTGDFVYAPRAACEVATIKRGGSVAGSVTKKVTYLVVGGLGSKEWKHGSFGTKIEKAIEYKRNGVPLLIVHEDQWVAALIPDQ